MDRVDVGADTASKRGADTRETVAFDLETTLVHQLHRALQAAASEFGRAVGGGGLTPRQFAVLSVVARHPDANQSDIVAATHIDRSTMADIVGRLERVGLVARSRANEDRRSYKLRLTSKGEQALARTVPLASRMEEEMLGVLSPAERRQLFEALQALSGSKAQETRQ